MSSRVLGPNQKKWVEALESGKYQQGENFLHSGKGYCCLGVACAVFEENAELILETVAKSGDAVTSYDGADTLAPKYVIRVLDLYGSGGEPDKTFNESLEDLTQLNDGGTTFKEIAQIIRDNPAAYFMSEQ